MLLKKTSTSLIFTKLIVFRALFASEILRVDSPVSNIIYVPQVRPPGLPWCKCPDIFVGQHMTRHNKKEATVRPLPQPSKDLMPTQRKPLPVISYLLNNCPT